jgi:hypothetical protein
MQLACLPPELAFLKSIHTPLPRLLHRISLLCAREDMEVIVPLRAALASWPKLGSRARVTLPLDGKAVGEEEEERVDGVLVFADEVAEREEVVMVSVEGVGVPLEGGWGTPEERPWILVEQQIIERQ